MLIKMRQFVIEFPEPRGPQIPTSGSATAQLTTVFSFQSFAEAASSRDLLDEFCNWMSRYEQSRAWHHDIAVLLTRRSTCETQGSSCNTLGKSLKCGPFESKCTALRCRHVHVQGHGVRAWHKGVA